MVLGTRVGGKMGKELGTNRFLGQRHLSKSSGDQGTMYKDKTTNHHQQNRTKHKTLDK